MFKNIDLTDSGVNVEESAVIALEQFLKFRLPDDYRQFLLDANGGRPEPNAFPLQDNPNDTFGLIERFFSLGNDDSDHDLIDNLAVFQNRVPSDLLPIAFDPGGNIICLGVSGEKKGGIYFWDHNDESMPGEEPDYHNIYFIAPSFDEFILNLTTLPQ